MTMPRLITATSNVSRTLKGISIRLSLPTRSGSMTMGLIRTATPKIRLVLNRLEPITFPSAMGLAPSREANTLTTNSGRLVP